MYKKFIIIIPAYNEEASIGPVLSSLCRIVHNRKRIVVIDDGSTDNTGIEAKKFGITVIRLNRNYGTKEAIKVGFTFAYRKGAEYTVQFDADGQHDAVDLPIIMKKIEQSQADLVIGSRYAKKTAYQTSVVRKECVAILSWFIDYMLDKRVYDPTSGYRIYSRKAIHFLLRYPDLLYPEPVSVAALIRYGYKIREKTVQMHPRIAGKSKLTLYKGSSCFFQSIKMIFGLRH